MSSTDPLDNPRPIRTPSQDPMLAAIVALVCRTREEDNRMQGMLSKFCRFRRHREYLEPLIHSDPVAAKWYHDSIMLWQSKATPYNDSLLKFIPDEGF